MVASTLIVAIMQALNILSAGMEQPVVPIEPRPLHHIFVMLVLAMKREALLL